MVKILSLFADKRHRRPVAKLRQERRSLSPFHDKQSRQYLESG